MGGSGRTPYATENHNTSQKSARNPNVTPWLIVIHHAATQDFDAVVRMELGTKQVSSTVVVKDGRVASMFDEAYRAWSLSSTYYDSVSLSSETCNSGGAAQGWPISEASYKTLAKIVATWCKKYGIPANRERIIGHREVYTRYGASYATACPGGIDLDRLVRMVNDTLTGTAGGDYTPIEEDFMSALTDDEQKNLYNSVVFIANQMNGWIATDREPKGTLANFLRNEAPRITEILYAVDGGADPAVVDKDKKPVARALAQFLRNGMTDAQVEALAKKVASQVQVPAGADAAAIEAAVDKAFGKIFR